MSDALLNGAPMDQGLMHSRALHYGDGVFRTVFCVHGAMLDWQRHLQKLAADCVALDLQMPDPELLREEAQSLALSPQRCVLKIMLLRCAVGRGYAPQGRACERLLMRYPAPHYPAACWERGVKIFRSTITLASQPLLAGVKHLNRLEQVLASRNWPTDAAEGILSDQAGHVISGTRSNVFWSRGGRLYTPDLSGCGVAGMMRTKVLEIADGLGIACEILQADDRELQCADEMFLTNSLIGIWPVNACYAWDEKPRAAPGPLTRRCMEILNHPPLC